MCCEKCKYRTFDDYLDDYSCSNEESEEYTCYVRPSDICSMYEEDVDKKIRVAGMGYV